MVLFTLLHKMRRKRTRSPSTPSMPSTVSSETASEESSSEESSEDSSASSDAASSSSEDEPLRSSRPTTRKKAEEERQRRRSLSASKPPRKRSKTANGSAPNTRKSVEISVIEKVKLRHREAAAAKLKQQLELQHQQHTKQQQNHAESNGKANNNANNRSKSSASSATTKSSATIPRQSSIASSETHSKPARSHAKAEGGKSCVRKTDPEVIFRMFDKPSRIYQCLAARQHDRPIILKRNLSYMTAKNKIAKKTDSKDQRFKLPLKMTANEAVLGDQSNNCLLSPTSKSKSTRNTRLSVIASKQSDPKSNNLNLVFCRVVGSIPGKPVNRSSRKSVGSGSGNTSGGGSKSESFLIDVVVNRAYVGKNLETKSQVDAVHSKLKVDFTRCGTDGLNNTPGDEDFFDAANNQLLENSHNPPKIVTIEGNLLYPPNGYIQGRATVLIRAITEGVGWVYDIEMEVSRDRDRKLENGYYSAHFRPINGAEEVSTNNPRLLFAVCWSPAHVVWDCEQVFENLRREIVRLPPSLKLNLTAHKPRTQQLPTIPPSSPNSSPTKSPSRTRIIRVVFWLSDPSAGGPGICASVANPFRCPWCHTVCPHFLSLLRHLRCWHPRFNFVLQAERVARVADILVTLNRHYNCVEEHCHPPTLVADVPLVGIEKPVKRFSNTQIIWTAGKGKHRRNFHKASSTALAEFRRPESNMNPSSMVMLAGHLRTYYHSQTSLPMTNEEFEGDRDSDDDEQPWLIEQSWRLLNEFTDVNSGEKVMMHTWNRFMHSEKFFAQRSIFPACLAFVDLHGPDLVANHLLGNFRLHLTCLSQNNLLSAPQFYAVMCRLQKRLDESKQPAATSPSKMAGPSNSITAIPSPANKDRPLRRSLSSTG